MDTRNRLNAALGITATDFATALAATRAGTRWARRNPLGEPEAADTAADRYAAKHGAGTRSFYRSAVTCEFWNPRDCQPVRDL